MFPPAAVSTAAGIKTADAPEVESERSPPSAADVESVCKVVSRVRDLSFKKAVPLESFSQEALHSRTRESLLGRKEQLQVEELFLKKIGLIPRYINLFELFMNTDPYAIRGYYDPETGKMSIADDLDGKERSMVLAHELTHALQDQHFNLETFLDREDGEVLSDDEILARRSVAEGEATSVMIGYMLWDRSFEFTALPNPVAESQVLRNIVQAMYPNTKLLPEFFQDVFGFPYVYGRNFFREFRLSRPWSGVAGLYEDPPRSTEQIMHPRKYLEERDEPVVLSTVDFSKLKSFGWTRSYRGTLGEYETYLLLREHTDFAIASLASEGWDGDEEVLYEDGENGAHHLVYLSTWDTRQDAEEFFWAYRDIVQEKYVEEKTLEGGGDSAILWKTEDGIALLDIRGRDVLAIEGDLPLPTLTALRRMIWASEGKKRPEILEDTPPPAEVLSQAYFNKAMDIKSEFEYRGVVPELLIAKAFMEKAVEIDPACAQCYAELADLVIRAGGYTPESAAEALPLVEKARESSGESPEVNRIFAFIHYIQGQHAKAVEEIRRAIAIDPDNPRYYKILGENYEQLGRTDEALAAWREGTRHEGSASVIAALYSNLGNYEEDEEARLSLYEKALDLEPKPENMRNYAIALARNGRCEDAIYVTNQALKESIGNWVFFLRGQCYLALGNAESAEEEFLSAARNGAIGELVTFYLMSRQAEKALEWEERLVVEGLMTAEAYHQLCEAYQRQNMVDEALSRCEKALEMDPELCDAHVLVGLIHEEKKSMDDAEEEYKKALAAPKVSSRAFYFMGRLQEKKGQIQKAYHFYQKAIEVEPSAMLYFELGRLLEDKMNLHEEGLELLLKVLRMAPRYEGLHYLIGKAYANLDDYENSRRHWEKYLELEPKGGFSGFIRSRITKKPWAETSSK